MLCFSRIACFNWRTSIDHDTTITAHVGVKDNQSSNSKNKKHHTKKSFLVENLFACLLLEKKGSYPCHNLHLRTFFVVTLGHW